VANNTAPMWVRSPNFGMVATTLTTALSYGLPEDYAATGVGLGFLLVVHRVVLRGADGATVRRFGLALGGLLEPEPIEWHRTLRELTRAVLASLMVALVVFPPFTAGWLLWYAPDAGFSPPVMSDVGHQAMGQLLVIALPEEAFYRGYLQRAFDDAWPPRIRVFGARLGPGLLLASLLFAVGHVLTQPQPQRLAVFFPALLFGWLRARTGGIGASVCLHAMSNLFASYLALGYGLEA
jgi:membrane protease YdiL (CAAX protease family)